MKPFGLKKEERLSSSKVIGDLFAGGESFFIFPLKVVFRETDLPVSYPVQAAFSVSKRNFKKAVERNLLKRRMREAYRLNKSILYQACGDQRKIAVMFIYVAQEVKDYSLIERSMKLALSKLAGRKQS